MQPSMIMTIGPKEAIRLLEKNANNPALDGGDA